MHGIITRENLLITALIFPVVAHITAQTVMAAAHTGYHFVAKRVRKTHRPKAHKPAHPAA